MTTKDKQRTRAVRLQQKQNRLAKQLQHNELKAQTEVKAEADAPELDDDTKALEPAEKCMDDMPYMYYGGATTFADAFAAMEAEEAARKMHENTYLFQEIVSNILNSDSITDKAGAIASAAEELKAIMARPEMDEMKSVEAQPVESGPDEVDEEEEPDEEKSMLTQIYDWVKAKLAPAAKEPEPPQTKSDSLPFFVYKDSEGQSHWFGVVSNKFRDRDTRNHPKGEIITEGAHKEFVEYLNANPTQAPELWSWHTPGTARKSRADWWDYTGEGFLVMSGPLTDDEAKAFSDGEQLGMSHGFYALERDTAQGLINKYRTFEVSELLPQFVANEWTDFAAIRKEIEMAFTPEKRGHLVKRYGEAKVAELEGNISGMAKALESIGAEWKDAQPEPPKPEAPSAQPVEAKNTDEAVQHVLAALNLPELQSAIKAISEQAALVPQLQAQVKALDEKLTALNKSDDEKIAEKLAPKVKPFDWGFRASTNPETAVKENDPADQALKKTAPSDNWLQNVSPIVA